MKPLKNWKLNQQHQNFVELEVDNKHLFRIYVLDDSLFRVLVKKKKANWHLIELGVLHRIKTSLGWGVSVKILVVLHSQNTNLKHRKIVFQLQLIH